MVDKVPLYITIGNTITNSMNFDDNVYLKSLEFKMIGFKISVDDDKICGIRFVYQNVNSGRKITCNDLCINGENINQYEFEIGQNDYIQVIYGYHEQYITQFGVITYNGQQVMFGKDKGYKYNFLYMGYTFTAAFGTSNKGMIESLGFRTRKLPKKVILEQFSPLIDIIYPNNDNLVPQKYEPIDYQTLQSYSSDFYNNNSYKQQSGTAGTMAKTAFGTFAAIETINMIEKAGDQHYHHTNVVTSNNKRHHAHHSNQQGSNHGINIGHHGILGRIFGGTLGHHHGHHGHHGHHHRGHHGGHHHR